MEDWFQLLITAFGGVMIGGVLQAFLVQPRIDRSEKKRWLRDNRLEAFSVLAEYLISYGDEKKHTLPSHVLRAKFAKAFLLIDDETLAAKIESFFYEVNNIYKDAAKIKNDDVQEKIKLWQDADKIKEESRNILKKLKEQVSSL